MTLSPENAKKAYHTIISCLIGDGSKNGICGINSVGQFDPEDSGRVAIPRNINAAFLISLSGEGHSCYTRAKEYLEEMESDPLWTNLVTFYREGLSLLLEEFQGFCSISNNRAEKVERLEKTLREQKEPLSNSQTIQEDIWSIFHPEATDILSNKEFRTESLRNRRRVEITNLNPMPIKSVPQEIIFTSNALLTIPPAGRRFKDLDINPSLWNLLEDVIQEEQLFWYDHPVQIGVEPERNEILYGLHHLSEALLYERNIKSVREDEVLTCVLSASVTHEGLQGIVKEYIEYELKKSHDLPGLKVHLFTEAETAELIHEILVPAANRYLNIDKDLSSFLREVVGVNGKYGRHYSFLKAITAFWQVFIDPSKRATFKIDLDQVFPQEKLLEETGKSAFQHMMSPLWGAEGVDTEGNAVYLGMMAGALVNEKDIGTSLFTPDVTYPDPPFKGEDSLFCSKIPQALSTVSEMMTRYDKSDLDGTNSCISRIHVTGGTNGILVEALRRYRPFTPVFIGRAEDQAYLLSAIYAKDKEPVLRYFHNYGLVMRHDKQAFAADAIKAAALGKIVGDYERILFFSNYARILSSDIDEVKGVIDPFTGSFVSPLPKNLAYLRLALKAAELFATSEEENEYKGFALLETGHRRLRANLQEVSMGDGNGLKERYEREIKAWDLYYDVLDKVENALGKGDTFALELREKAKKLVQKTRVIVGGKSSL
ncbi:MAG: hypothetical protein D8M57_10515 [Candidatus Scalindua sp. AMX11]|nr:MAG: hypothetical protein DWQ00_03490 [Candidatus Scalindua sp.]NOG83162.1 hypothetical protein [Planctomycetota bacterium]RZV75826.1 MAG: hypothetical protein EX341_12300 [Candidatus Scalindua sp. SCAELEC01]TDE64883.1 MAG: hypothetical protein D8M57_10515 [Candidatus Scalindua sp. AMX11]GJQ60350.1 MAG: hypothetical protein SCALA701_31510 [Candidatus Scalindua sp.]